MNHAHELPVTKSHLTQVSMFLKHLVLPTWYFISWPYVSKQEQTIRFALRKTSSWRNDVGLLPYLPSVCFCSSASSWLFWWVSSRAGCSCARWRAPSCSCSLPSHRERIQQWMPRPQIFVFSLPGKMERDSEEIWKKLEKKTLMSLFKPTWDCCWF